MHSVNSYVLFRSTHISNLGHGHVNLIGLSLPGNLDIYGSNVPIELGHLLIGQIPKQCTT